MNEYTNTNRELKKKNWILQDSKELQVAEQHELSKQEQIIENLGQLVNIGLKYIMPYVIL